MDQWKDVTPGGKKICSTFDKSYIMTYDRAVAYYGGRCVTLLSALCYEPESPSVSIFTHIRYFMYFNSHKNLANSVLFNISCSIFYQNGIRFKVNVVISKDLFNTRN